MNETTARQEEKTRKADEAKGSVKVGVVVKDVDLKKPTPPSRPFPSLPLPPSNQNKEWRGGKVSEESGEEVFYFLLLFFPRQLMHSIRSRKNTSNLPLLLKDNAHEMYSTPPYVKGKQTSA